MREGTRTAATPSGGPENGLTALSGMMETFHIASGYPRAREACASTERTPHVSKTPPTATPITGEP